MPYIRRTSIMPSGYSVRTPGPLSGTFFWIRFLFPLAIRSSLPKSLAQKSYIDSIRSKDIVFGIDLQVQVKPIWPWPWAISFLLKKEVSRIVLVRPAVEAGEKLGFLPGDLAEKVNPYLRPLYDALFDMMAFEKAQELIDKGIIESGTVGFYARPNTERCFCYSG